MSPKGPRKHQEKKIGLLKNVIILRSYKPVFALKNHHRTDKKYLIHIGDFGVFK